MNYNKNAKINEIRGKMRLKNINISLDIATTYIFYRRLNDNLKND